MAFSISHAIIPAEEAENIKLLAEVNFDKPILSILSCCFILAIGLLYLSLLGIDLLDYILHV